jgi:thioester reductase-like protein
MVDYMFRDDPRVFEDDPVTSADGLFGGYGDSKWVCERLMEQARERGLPVVVYRPGVLSGDSRTGIGNTRDMVWNLIRACVQMGTTPTGDKPLDIVPVDYVAAGIVRLSLTDGASGPVYHFANSNPPEFRLCFEVLHAYGYPLTWVPSDEWDAAVVEAAKSDPNHALAPYAAVVANLERSVERAEARQMSGQAKALVFDDTKAKTALAGSGIDSPPIDEELFHTYFDHFVATGFLPAPPGAR